MVYFVRGEDCREGYHTIPLWRSVTPNSVHLTCYVKQEHFVHRR